MCYLEEVLIRKQWVALTLEAAVSMAVVTSIFSLWEVRAWVRYEVGCVHLIHHVAPGRKTVHFIAVRDICVLPKVIGLSAAGLTAILAATPVWIIVTIILVGL